MITIPIYDFSCPKCNKQYKDIKIKLSEKEKFTKLCDSCNIELVQVVAPLRFKLEGAGWYADNDHPYGITQTELDNNLEQEKRKEDEIYNYDANESKIKEL